MAPSHETTADVAAPSVLSTLPERLGWYAAVARLAPSKFNAQPWRFLVHDGVLDVWADRGLMPVTDPLGRELVLSCGAAVHTAQVAAASLGVRLAVTTWPLGDDGPVARLTEDGRGTPTALDRELLAAVTRRRTDRGPLDASVLSPAVPFLLQRSAEEHGCTLRLVTGDGDRSTLARIVQAADHQLVSRPEVEREVHDWVRDASADRSDGVPQEASRGQAASYAAPFVQRDFSFGAVPPEHDRPGADAPLVAVLCAAADTPRDWLQAGQALMAVLLTATVHGANASYLNQPLELPHTRDWLRDELDLPGPPQVVLRMGVGAPVAPTPRRTVEDVVLRG